MSADLTPTEGPGAAEAEPSKRTYQRPELSELGSLTDLTGADGGPAGTTDGATDYSTSG